MSLTPDAKIVHEDLLHMINRIRGIESDLVRIYTRLVLMLPQVPDA